MIEFQYTKFDEVEVPGQYTEVYEFGQNAANGELGFGPDQPKSATKPQRHEPLVGVVVLR